MQIVTHEIRNDALTTNFTVSVTMRSKPIIASICYHIVIMLLMESLPFTIIIKTAHTYGLFDQEVDKYLIRIIVADMPKTSIYIIMDHIIKGYQTSKKETISSSQKKVVVYQLINIYLFFELQRTFSYQWCTDIEQGCNWFYSDTIINIM